MTQHGGDRGDSARDGRGVDRFEDPYAKKRARQAAQRAAQERRDHDPRPPTDEDWTASTDEGSHLRIVAPPAELGDLLAGMVGRRRWADRLRGVAIFDRWEEIVGPQLASRCEPVRLAGGTLVVRAVDQAWSTQLGYMLTQITDKANRVLGDGMVSEVRVTVGPLQGRPDGA